VRLDTWVQRVTGVPMEPHQHCRIQPGACRVHALHRQRPRVAKVRLDLAQVLGVPAERVRVLCKDMGGNFGTRNLFYPNTRSSLGRHAGSAGGQMDCERSESFPAIIRGAT